MFLKATAKMSKTINLKGDLILKIWSRLNIR